MHRRNVSIKYLVAAMLMRISLSIKFTAKLKVCWKICVFLKISCELTIFIFNYIYFKKQSMKIFLNHIILQNLLHALAKYLLNLLKLACINTMILYIGTNGIMMYDTLDDTTV